MSKFKIDNIHNIPVNQYIINIDDTDAYSYKQDKIISDILNNTIGKSYKCAILYVVINPKNADKSSLKPKIYQFLTDSDGNIFKIFHESLTISVYDNSGIDKEISEIKNDVSDLRKYISGASGLTGVYETTGVSGATSISDVSGATGLTGLYETTSVSGLTSISNVSGATGLTGSYETTSVSELTSIANVSGASGLTGSYETSDASGRTGLTGSYETTGVSGVTGN